MRSPEGHPVLAATLDLVMAPLAPVRPDVVGPARGRVLEIGFGTGLNLPVYGRVDSLDAIEPDPHMARRARARLGSVGFPVTIHEAGAEALPFDDASFDTVVATFVFCTIPDVDAAAREVLRVLRPGGELRFAEHVRSEKTPVGELQRALDPAWQRLAGGCHLTRDPVGLLRDAGAVDIEVRPRGWAWSLLPVITGRARR